MIKERPDEIDASGAALVCEHVATGSEPVRVAFRIEPSSPVDTGWQFFCGSAEEDPAAAKVWSLRDVLEEDAGLRDFLSLPPGTELFQQRNKWHIRQDEKTS